MKRRILWAIVTVTALAVLLFAVPLAFALSNLFRAEEVVRLERSAAEESARIPDSFPARSDPIEFSHGTATRVALYDRAGRRVRGSGPPAGDAVIRQALAGDVRDSQVGDTLVVGSPVLHGKRIVGALRLETPNSTVTNRTRDAILLMAGIAAIVIGISIAIATLQAKRLTRPVDRIASDAVRLGNGDFTIQTELSGVAELDAVSEALASTAARLDSTLTRERTFSEDASHQLRTPLTGLRLNLETARIDPEVDRDTALDAALGQIDRLDHTIDDLLALAREHPTAREPIELAPLLSALDDDWHGSLAVEGRPLHVAGDPGLPLVAVSGRALRQILDVLVENAWHHGGGEIFVHARRAPSGVVIEVADEGGGVRGDVDTIFVRRAPSAERHGIGLALARSLAETDGMRLTLLDPGPHPVFAVFVPNPTDTFPS